MSQCGTMFFISFCQFLRYLPLYNYQIIYVLLNPMLKNSEKTVTRGTNQPALDRKKMSLATIWYSFIFLAPIVL